MIKNIILLLLFLSTLFLNTLCLAQDKESDTFSFDEPENNEAAIDSCKARIGTARPRIKIDITRPIGGRGSTVYLIKGVVVGSCIDEAGYYEFGKLKDKFAIPLNDQLVRFEFSIISYRGINAELKVFSLDGRQYIVNVDEEIERARRLK